MGDNSSDIEFKITKAGLKDVPALLIGAKKFLEYYPVSLGVNILHLTKVMTHLVNNETVIMAYEKSDNIKNLLVPAGAIAGIIEGNFYNPNTIIGNELFWWVHPEYRNQGLGDELLRCFEKEMKLRGAKYIAMTSTANTPNLPDKLKTKEYKEAETKLIKELK